MVENLENEAKHKEESNGLIHYFLRVAFFFCILKTSWWLTGRPGVLWFMGSQTVRHDWATELNWTELIGNVFSYNTVWGPLPIINNASKLLNSHMMDTAIIFCIWHIKKLSYLLVSPQLVIQTQSFQFEPLRYHAMWMRWWGLLVALTYECVMVKSVFTSGSSLQHLVWQPPYSHVKFFSPDLGFLAVCTCFSFISSWLVFYDLGILRRQPYCECKPLPHRFLLFFRTS